MQSWPKVLTAINTNMYIVCYHVCWKSLRISYRNWNCKSFLITSLHEPASHVFPKSRSTTGAIALSITYGIDVKYHDDRFLNANVAAGRALATALVPGKFLVDNIPIRACIRTRTVTYKHLMNHLIVRYVPDWFPGTGFRALTKEVHDKSKIAADGPFEFVKKAMKVRPRSNLRSDCVFNLRVATSLARGFPGP